MEEQHQATETSKPQSGRLRRVGSRVLRELPWLLVIGAVYWAFSSSNTADIAIGEEPPAIRAQQIGTTAIIDTEELRGKPLVLVFWAPWCRVCSVEMPLLGELQAAFGDRAAVIGVGLSGGQGEMQEFAERHGTSFPQVFGNRQISAAYGIRAFPTIFVMDGQGRVHEQFVGLTTPWRVRWTVSRMLD